MISVVVDGEFPILLDRSGSVSVSVSTSRSGFVTVIRLVSLMATRELIEENLERAVGGLVVRVTVVGSALVVGGSGGGFERMENEEGDIVGETKTVLRRLIRIGAGTGIGTGIGGK